MILSAIKASAESNIHRWSGCIKVIMLMCVFLIALGTLGSNCDNKDPVLEENAEGTLTAKPDSVTVKVNDEFLIIVHYCFLILQKRLFLLFPL